MRWCGAGAESIPAIEIMISRIDSRSLINEEKTYMVREAIAPAFTVRHADVDHRLQSFPVWFDFAE